MMNNPKPISEFLVPGKRAHLVGIGGVSMCPLAEAIYFEDNEFTPRALYLAQDVCVT